MPFSKPFYLFNSSGTTSLEIGVPTGANSIPCRTTVRLFSPLRVACIGAATIVLLLGPTKVVQCQRWEDLRKAPNKPQQAAINTNAMISPQRLQMLYRVNLPHRFDRGREHVSLSSMFFVFLALYLSSASWLPGLPSVKSLPPTLILW